MAHVRSTLEYTKLYVRLVSALVASLLDLGKVLIQRWAVVLQAVIKVSQLVYLLKASALLIPPT